MNSMGIVVVACALAGVGVAALVRPAVEKRQLFSVTIRFDAGRSLGKFREIWRFFGADEPNYATMPNGRKLIGELGSLRPKEVYFRTHNLLTTGDGKPALKWGSTNAYTEDAQGRPVYDWHILDGIFDTYHKNGVRPYVEIGFMPEALSIHPSPYRHHWTPTARYDEIYTGWSYPPKDYTKWSELAYQWAKHCIDRYGHKEVEQWYWETWNEPNIGYWHGTRDEFFKLHDYAIAGIKRALPNAKVGGADTAGGGRYFQAFLEHCLHGTSLATGATGTPLDFVSFHAKGSPNYVDGHVQMGISAQLKTVDENFRIVSQFPELKSTPIVIGESDPEGCAACQGPTLGYRNGTMYSSYTAAIFARKLDLADKYGVNFEGALTWAFTFEDQPYFAGFRQLATGGIDLPVLNVFRMYSRMGGERVATESNSAVPLDSIVAHGVRENPDVSALASLGGHKLAVMVWHYHDDDVAGPDANVSLQLTGLPLEQGEARVTEYRIDETHSNSYTAWKAMGSPQQPSASQLRMLQKAGQLARIELPRIAISNHQGRLETVLPRQAVALFVVEF